jgi:hypothetical protein
MPTARAIIGEPIRTTTRNNPSLTTFIFIAVYFPPLKYFHLILIKLKGAKFSFDDILSH